MNIGKATEFSHPVQSNAPKSAHEANQKKTSTLAADNLENKDKFEHNTPNYSPTYAKPGAKSGGAQNDITDFGNPKRSVLQMKNEALKSMVHSTLTGQASGAAGSYSPLFKASEDIMNALRAAESTSEGKDYWSVDATAERIFTFAKSLAGEDTETLSKMRSAFEKGYKMAVGEMGGKAPSISKQTYAKVNELFDNYEKELNDAAKAKTGTAAEGASSTD